MPVFYFNVINTAGKICDPEGSELANIEIAEAEAILDARRLMSDAILDGRDISGRSIEICDATGDILRTVLFKSALNRAD